MFARSSLIYLAGIIATRLCSLLLLPIFTRNLDPAEFGVLELLNRATEVLLLCLFLNGNCMATVALYNQCRDPDRKRTIAGSSLAFGGLSVGVIGAVSLLLAPLIRVWLGVPSTGLVRLALLAAMADALVVICLAHIQARVEAMVYSAFTLAQVLVRVALIAWLVCGLGLGIRGILAASLVTSGGMAAVLVFREVRRSGLVLDGTTFRELAWFGLPFLPSGLCGLLLGTGDQFFLLRYVSTWEIGLYALAYKLATIPGMLTRDPIMKVWGARMHVVASEPDAPCVFGRVFTRFVLIFATAGLGLVLFCDELLYFLSDPNYRGAVRYLPPIVLAYFFASCTDFLDAPFYIRRLTWQRLIITFSSTAVMFGLYLLLIPPWGAMGAAVATLLGLLIRMLITYAVSQRLFRVSYEHRRLAAVLIITLGFGACGRLIVLPWVWGIPLKLALFFLWAAVMAATGLVDPDDKRVLTGMLGQFGEWFPFGQRARPRFGPKPPPEPAIAIKETVG